MAEVIWTNAAKNDYWKNIEYLQSEWTLQEVYNFIDKTDALILLLLKQNLVFKPTDYKDVFHVPVTKQITLYYRILENYNIELLRFWNTYQNPKKLKL
ncbi:type II toxin-antitoxin system RelE/ParE family toxin [Flavobacterium sp. HBTb2-11-1]|uniref:type II toxin-antitoxin system RelE/ParE family toxin n=1 Tax=Flavobacterium sp. HBTb2-11-1 TaxID=2692212 RepID=UPI00136A7F7E|nr:type II toxin-antitoxin system RelE/ParE family toxin [Flavobacterium sp. HBTb2-11-1]MXO03293.1 type II toxin-antitoxin system RelE/ParE family toxin [Flavobacterium sp. HBTb2-11-1]